MIKHRIRDNIVSIITSLALVSGIALPSLSMSAYADEAPVPDIPPDTTEQVGDSTNEHSVTSLLIPRDNTDENVAATTFRAYKLFDADVIYSDGKDIVSNLVFKAGQEENVINLLYTALGIDFKAVSSIEDDQLRAFAAEDNQVAKAALAAEIIQDYLRGSAVSEGSEQVKPDSMEFGSNLAKNLFNSQLSYISMTAGEWSDLAGSGEGYYVIVSNDISSGDVATYPLFVTVGGHAKEITTKRSLPSIKKFVKDDDSSTWGTSADQSRGEKLDFKLQAQLPSDLMNYDNYPLEIIDTPSGMTIDKDSVKVFVNDDIVYDNANSPVAGSGNDNNSGNSGSGSNSGGSGTESGSSNGDSGSGSTSGGDSGSGIVAMSGDDSSYGISVMTEVGNNSGFVPLPGGVEVSTLVLKIGTDKSIYTLGEHIQVIAIAKIGDTVFTPENLTWSSSDSDIIDVKYNYGDPNDDYTKTFFAKKEGTVTLQAIMNNDIIAKRTLTIVSDSSAMHQTSLQEYYGDVITGSRVKLYFSCNDIFGFSSENYKIYSMNSNIAEVETIDQEDHNAIIYTKKSGECYIIIETYDENNQLIFSGTKINIRDYDPNMYEESSKPKYLSLVEQQNDYYVTLQDIVEIPYNSNIDNINSEFHLNITPNNGTIQYSKTYTPDWSENPNIPLLQLIPYDVGDYQIKLRLDNYNQECTNTETINLHVTKEPITNLFFYNTTETITRGPQIPLSVWCDQSLTKQSDAYDLTITSSNPDIVEVQEYYYPSGDAIQFYVTGKQVGEADITVSSTNDVSATCHIIVQEQVSTPSDSGGTTTSTTSPEYPATHLEIGAYRDWHWVNEAIWISCAYDGNLSVKDLIWTSSNPDIVLFINEFQYLNTGTLALFEAKSAGTATITAKTADGRLSASWDINVLPYNEDNESFRATVFLDVFSPDVYANETSTYNYELRNGITSEQIMFASSDERIMKIESIDTLNNTVTVKGIANGNASLILKSKPDSGMNVFLSKQLNVSGGSDPEPTVPDHPIEEKYTTGFMVTLEDPATGEGTIKIDERVQLPEIEVVPGFGEVDENVLTVAFDNILKNVTSPDDIITVTYTATINGSSEETKNNAAYINYAANPYQRTEKHDVMKKSASVTTEINNYRFNILKTDVSTSDTFNALAGSEFSIKTADGKYIVTDGNGKVSSETTSVTPIKLTNYDGINPTGMLFSIDGLDSGTYTVTEETAPTGYNKLFESFTVTIAKDGTITLGGNEEGTLNHGKVQQCPVNFSGSALEPFLNGYTVQVKNSKGLELPITGQQGFILISIAGGLLIAIALISTLTSRKKKKNSKTTNIVS